MRRFGRKATKKTTPRPLCPGIEEKLKGYEEKIEQYEKRIKELEGEEGPVLPALVESPEYRPLSIKSSEMTLLAKWELVEEKAG